MRINRFFQLWNNCHEQSYLRLSTQQFLSILITMQYNLIAILLNKFNNLNPIIKSRMSQLEIIIQQIKVIGNLLPNSSLQPQELELPTNDRRFRLTFGDRIFISKETGYFKSPTQLTFYQPCSFMYDNHSRTLQLQIFKPHTFTDNTDIQYQLNSQIDLSDFRVVKGDFIEGLLTDINGTSVGKVLLILDVFRKGTRCVEKVGYQVLFDKVMQEAEREQREEMSRRRKVSAAGINIRNLMVNNQLGNTMMTINSMHIIPQIQDPQIFNKDCLIVIKQGPQIKAYTRPIKNQSKQPVSFLDYFQFLKNQHHKFQFFFIFIDDLGTYICKARGEIKYIVFDETVKAHSLVLTDRRSNKYGILMVKFVERQVEGNVNLVYKVDKKIKQSQVTQSIDSFNRYKFQSKYNNHVLSQKLSQLQLLKQKEEDEKNRPMNQQQKRKAQQHKKFIDFLQKQVQRIQRQLHKRDQKSKQVERKQKYLPNVKQKTYDKSMQVNRSFGSTVEFREGKIRLPKV